MTNTTPTRLTGAELAAAVRESPEGPHSVEMRTARAILDALRVIALTPRIVLALETIDPQAMRQVLEALWLATHERPQITEAHRARESIAGCLDRHRLGAAAAAVRDGQRVNAVLEHARGAVQTPEQLEQLENCGALWERFGDD